jgi:hypothetical protein
VRLKHEKYSSEEMMRHQSFSTKVTDRDPQSGRSEPHLKKMASINLSMTCVTFPKECKPDLWEFEQVFGKNIQTVFSLNTGDGAACAIEVVAKLDDWGYSTAGRGEYTEFS